MKNNKLIELTNKNYKIGKRIVAPRVGFPGVNMTGGSIKIAQQNYGEHYKEIRLISFPLELSVFSELQK